MKKEQPSQNQINDLFKCFHSGQYSDSEKLALSMIHEYPRCQFAWKVLGAVLGQLGRNLEAVNSHKKAVELSPQDAEAHCNLGISLQVINKLKEAEISYNNSISINPKYAEAHYNLANTLLKLGKTEKALSEYCEAIKYKPNYTEAFINFGTNIKNVRYISSNPSHYPIINKLLKIKNIIRPIDIAKSVLSLLKHEPIINRLLTKKTDLKNTYEVTNAIMSLHEVTLLHNLMRICPIPDLQFEELFMNLRKGLLFNLSDIKDNEKIIYFLKSLSLHCHTNEYVYFESNNETLLVQKLEDNIKNSLSKSKQPKLMELLCLTTYRHLFQYEWYDQLEELNHFKEVKVRFIDEPRVERDLKKDIPILAAISNNVSLDVKEQYEENPYPRWDNFSLMVKKKSITKIIKDIPLRLHSEKINDITSPNILIAGCGTGQQSIEVASNYSNSNVTAVDLSLCSLAYAKRKTNESEVKNINYIQADILDLHLIDEEFEIIESSGVLHHMDNPMFGWKILKDLLKSGGLMRIGLYSELARYEITKIREKLLPNIEKLSEFDIRKFRKSLIDLHFEEYQRTIMGRDFFSLSSFRDLIMHVKEHQFTISQIDKCLNELGLKFCGFENKQNISMLKNFYGNDVDIYNLKIWKEFEEKNPLIFAGMYQFWCQKP